MARPFWWRLVHALSGPFRAVARWLRPSVYGEARWIGAMERRVVLSPKHGGLVFGRGQRLTEEASFKNCCVLAPTGVGKTTRFGFPNLYDCTGSVVVTDPSSELFDRTSGAMAARGYGVQALDLGKVKRSLRFNPLAGISTPPELKRVAAMLAQNNAGSDQFWTAQATTLIYLCLLALWRGGDPARFHLGNVRLLLNRFGVGGEGIEQFMGERLDGAAHEEFLAFVATEDRVLSSIVASARAALELWSDPEVVAVTAGHTVDVSAIRKRKTVIYVIVPEDRVEYFSVLVNLFYVACFEYCLREVEGEAVYFFLDEFGNLGKIPNFSRFATTLRKRRCSISIILQELSQLKAVYGHHEATTIFAGGMTNKLFFGGLDLESCTYLERVLGKTTKTGWVPEGSEDGMRRVAVGQPLMSSDQVRMMGEREAVLISGSDLPMKLDMPRYYMDSVYRRLAAIPPVDRPEGGEMEVVWV